MCSLHTETAGIVLRNFFPNKLHADQPGEIFSPIATLRASDDAATAVLSKQV
jgi:hypothetical protein